MAFLEVKGITHRFPGVTALKDVDLTVDLGKIHALAGENGAGKSTLVKILFGELRPSEGDVLINGDDALRDPTLFNLVSFVPQEIRLFQNLTVAENMFVPFKKTGMFKYLIAHSRLNAAAQELIDQLGINVRPTHVVMNISIADQQLVQIARALANRRCKALILDEPTTSLTTREIERLFNVIRHLKSEGRAIIFISHKMAELFSLGDEVTVLRNGTLISHRPMQGLSERDLISLMSGEEVQFDQLFLPETPASRPILEVEGLSGHGFSDISFTLRQGEILGFAGLVGAGRSELMQTIFGYLKSTRGQISMNGHPWKLGDPTYSIDNGLFYLSEDRRRHGLLPFLSVRDNIGISLFDQTARAGVISATKEYNIVIETIDKFEIKTPTVRRKISFLSGGNQQKVIIGRAVACSPGLLIFDEPTKGIDVKTRVEIHKLMKKLAEGGVGIILVSSDLSELRRCASRIITMYHGMISGEFTTAHTDTRMLVAAMFGWGADRDAA
jgi:ribose transport system ATP-binding protein